MKIEIYQQFALKIRVFKNNVNQPSVTTLEKQTVF